MKNRLMKLSAEELERLRHSLTARENEAHEEKEASALASSGAHQERSSLELQMFHGMPQHIISGCTGGI